MQLLNKLQSTDFLVANSLMRDGKPLPLPSRHPKSRYGLFRLNKVAFLGSPSAKKIPIRVSGQGIRPRAKSGRTIEVTEQMPLVVSALWGKYSSWLLAWAHMGAQMEAANPSPDPS